MGWDLAPAGFTDDYTGTLADVVFADSQFGSQALATVALDEPFTRDDGTLATDRIIYLRIQKPFEIAADGTLAHPTNPDAKMKSDGSQWVKFAERVAELVPDVRTLIPGGISDASGWGGAGLRFHFMTEGAGESYSFKDESGATKSGKSKGLTMPVEYLGTTANPQAGSVGASVNGQGEFSLTSLPDDIIEAWTPYAESTTFQADVLKSGLLSPEKLGDAYGLVTKALGDGTLQKAFQAF